ncbi:hypothetical protein F2P81_010486 [Scophthalmus maximus]|uniref:Uncharacterized protein n=1 Tax=Scophthalmus maximus TaxID=52904 RepID=A0A6A4T5Y7_SCOMX|nr:hypothetical protein F2P81_010486 [Scophthalmus maximus]
MPSSMINDERKQEEAVMAKGRHQDNQRQQLEPANTNNRTGRNGGCGHHTGERDRSTGINEIGEMQRFISDP